MTVATSQIFQGNQLNLTTTERHPFNLGYPIAISQVDGSSPSDVWLIPTSADGANSQLSGVVSINRPDAIVSVTTTDPTGLSYNYGLVNPSYFNTSDSVVVFTVGTTNNWVGQVVSKGTQGGVTYINVIFGGQVPDAAKSATHIAKLESGLNSNYSAQRLTFEPYSFTIGDDTTRDLYNSFTFQDRKGNVWIYRGPHHVTDNPVMVMRYYYKTLAGFYFPSLPYDSQPPVGTITPYLRQRGADGNFAGDPVVGDSNENEGDDNALPILYAPAWPDGVPVLQMAETLTKPKRGLPAVRGQTSLRVLYQQSQIDGGSNAPSVVLHDPTREKQFVASSDPDDVDLLGKIPDSARNQYYNGKTFFPNLPPHLVDRFFFDPNRGPAGAFVLQGRFVNEPVGESYLLLNSLGNQDVNDLKALCTVDDPKKALWDAMVDGLSTDLETFHEDPAKPGTYKPDDTVVTVGPADLSAVASDDTAVDFYALSAVGPGTGYVTLVAGNGLAFTPVNDPVSIKIFRVSSQLYQGEIKIVASSNPLGEKVTLQQIADLAGQVDQYEFQWMITAPVDGAAPPVYQNTPQTLIQSGATWNHLLFPLGSDSAAGFQSIDSSRLVSDVRRSIIPVASQPFQSVATDSSGFVFSIATGQPQYLTSGNAVVLQDRHGVAVTGVVSSDTTPDSVSVAVDGGPSAIPTGFVPTEMDERVISGQPQASVYQEYSIPAGNRYADFWLSLRLDSALAANVFIDGQLAVTANTGTANDTSMSAPPSDLSPLPMAYRVNNGYFSAGTPQSDGTVLHSVVVALFSQAQAGVRQNFDLKLESHQAIDLTSQAGTPWLALDPVRYVDGIRAVLGGTADVRSLSDNYLIMRFRATDPNNASWISDSQGNNIGWSQWTEPQLAEGWIKRVLAGINPFNQRVTDLFNNKVNTDSSLLTEAGPRWEGDVALNLATINNYGLIEIYETVLRRGRALSVDAGINYGPANDALLLAAGYLSDLYMLVGNEAWADAANPTIGIGTKDSTYGSVATSLFSFQGQVASLMDEEQSLLRGRDDFAQPGVQTSPVYNRLYWNYTRGISSGEVIYALNYNIKPNPNVPSTGSITAADAQHMFPQGHGDAYGHYLMAVKGYYSLLMNNSFDWVPRPEAVTILGKPVQVDYQDERKFAAAAAAVARTADQVFDLAWRSEYEPDHAHGWSNLSPSRSNLHRNVATVRYWGADHWASRGIQGAYLNWVVGNAILPAVDSDPSHEGIQKIDRTTVPELAELPTTAADIQKHLDNAEGGLSPLGLPNNGVAFDINPGLMTGANPVTHFEQIYDRALGTLNNAVTAFDSAKNVTEIMRSQQDSLSDYQAQVTSQETAYQNSLIDLYGTPYPDDIGPGKTYVQGYTGPDLVHFAYVDETDLPGTGNADTGYPLPNESASFQIDIQLLPTNWYNAGNLATDFNFVVTADSDNYTEGTNYITFNVGPRGFYEKPTQWQSVRRSPGSIQQAISDIMATHWRVVQVLNEASGDKQDLDKAIDLFKSKVATHDQIYKYEKDKFDAETTLAAVQAASDLFDKGVESYKSVADLTSDAIKEAIPKEFVAGLANGGDLTSTARAVLDSTKGITEGTFDALKFAKDAVVLSLGVAVERATASVDLFDIAPLEWRQEQREAIIELQDRLNGLQDDISRINAQLSQLGDAQRKFRTLQAQGDRIQGEREVFRQHTAAIIQGYRTRDAAFRLFRNEKLERYKSLFDLASRYALLAAQAYDYETGLLNTDQGKAFIQRIVAARALGLVTDGKPQYAGSDTGDPGLSSALAEMKADWDTLKGRLGFNNPDGYGTTASLRSENFRILPGSDGDTAWSDLLNRYRSDNILNDADVLRFCQQINPGGGLAVPGIVIPFSTTIATGRNLFGQLLAPGDHAFSPSSFATKIFGVGISLDGYIGMDVPSANGSAIASGGGASPSDPGVTFLDPNALAANPYVYLIPTGVDSMRTPPLGDSSEIRTWNVADVSVPLPFNIGASDQSTRQLWQSSASLTEPLFSERKHQAFRPVADTGIFKGYNVYGPGGSLQRSQYTNGRLIGRSVWNSGWKLVIPGNTLLNDPNDGLDRFVRAVKDVHVFYQTYSYSGN